MGGGCLRKVPCWRRGSVEEDWEDEEVLEGEKVDDVFVSYMGGDGGDGADLSPQFADWVIEVCEALQLRAYKDPTNLERVVDEDAVKDRVFQSRVVVGIISEEFLKEMNGPQEELWWALKENIPIIPLYDGDRYTELTAAAWIDEYPFFARVPVVYKRSAHKEVKDALIMQLYDVLDASYANELPASVEKRFTKFFKQLEKAETGRDTQRTVAPATTGGSRASGSRKRTSFLFDEIEADAAAHAKHFRFKDEEKIVKEDDAQGVQRLLKSLKDPLGRREQQQRLLMLTEGGTESEGFYEPCHHKDLPVRSILKGSRDAASTPGAKVAHVADFASAALDPKVQQSVERLGTYLEGVAKDDMTQLPTVLRVLQLMVPNLPVVTKALAVVFDFVKDIAYCRQVVAQQGGIKDIIDAMAVHTGSVSLQSYACGCLYALSCYRADNPERDNNSAAIAHAGGIGRLTEAMAAFPSCREVQQWGAGALRHLAMDIGSNRRDISEGGEVQLTMRGINKRMIVKKGGIELLVKAMLKFPDDIEIQDNGCAALCNLLGGRQDTKVRAARAGCIRGGVSALRAFPEEPDISQSACALLRGLALGVPENKIAIVAQGGVRQLCQAIARHRMEPEVNLQAMAALCNLTSQVVENKKSIVEAGGLEQAVAALRTFPENAELQQQGCGMLHNIACELSLRDNVLAAGGLSIAEVAMKHEVRTVRSVASMLYRLLEDDDDASPTAALENELRVSSRRAGVSQKPAAEDKKEGLDSLFAPRRPSEGSATGSGRSRALTKPQKKIMSDVMDDMKNNPSGWMPADGEAASEDGAGSGESARKGRRKKRRGGGGGDEGASPRSEASSGGGRWDTKRQQQASSFGVDDLEGLSDGSAQAGPSAGDFDFIVRRGMSKGGLGSGQGSAEAGRKSGSASSVGSPSVASGAGDTAEYLASETASEATSTPQSSEAEHEGTPTPSNGALSPRSPHRPGPPGRDGMGTGQSPRGASPRGASPRAGRQSPGGGPPRSPGAMRSPGGAGSPKAGGSPQSPRGQVKTWSPRTARLSPGEKRSPRPNAGSPRRGSPSGSPGSGHRSPKGDHVDEESYYDWDSEFEGGEEAEGWIDLYGDHHAGRRFLRRLNQEEPKVAADEVENEGAAALEELLKEVDVEVAPPIKTTKVRRTAEKMKFAQALALCRDAPPERFEEDWKDVLMARYEYSQRNAVYRSARSACVGSAGLGIALLHQLDGVTKGMKTSLGESHGAAKETIKRHTMAAEVLAAQIREDGVVQVMNKTEIGHRLHGDDDGDSIFDMAELQELGVAETALVMASTNTMDAGDKAKAKLNIGRRSTASFGNSSEELQWMARDLEKRREDRRRVKIF